MTRLWFRPPAVQLYISSFLGLLDLKTGALIISLFALFNKTAGLFGLLAVFQGGSAAQISLYLYSCLSILLFLWALRGIADEDSARCMRYAHAFLADHMLSSAWTLLFGISWFLYTPHDGSRPQLAPHQAGLMALIEGIEKSYEVPGSIKHHVPLEGEARKVAAKQVWDEERGFSAAVLASGFALKLYFALVLYSFALHLRHGTYRSLPLSRAAAGSGATSSGAGPRAGGAEGAYAALARAEDEEMLPWSEDEEEEEGKERRREGRQ